MLQVLNKVDLIDKTRLNDLQQLFSANAAVDMVLPASALMGRGTEDIKQWALSKLPLGPTLYPKVTVFCKHAASMPLQQPNHCLCV